MSRAQMSRMLVLVALAAVFLLRSDSRGKDASKNAEPVAEPNEQTAVQHAARRDRRA